MKLTLAWLCVCLAIYCGGGHGHGNVVLSLPPSLIAQAALSHNPHHEHHEHHEHQEHHQQQQQQHEEKEKKDARVLFDSGSDALRDMLRNSPTAANSAKFSGLAEQSEDFNRNADDLGERVPQSAPQEIAAQPLGMGFGLGLGLGLEGNYRTTPPHRYWGNRCQGRPNRDCPPEYYRTRLAARNKEALARLHLQLSSMQEGRDSSEEEALDEDDSDSDSDEDETNNEVFMLLTGEQDLIKFLHWAMQLLYPYQRPLANLSEGAAENYYPGMFLWKKLNLSGHLEPPLIVDEPQYVLVRREKLFDGVQWGEELSKENDPFIPPRGRKHNSPDLDALLNRYEPFVPNRGKRDKVKDLFKYDDLFYPHRGKKHRNLFQVDDPFFATRGKKLQLRDLYNSDDPFVPNRGKRHLAGGKIWWQAQGQGQGQGQEEEKSDDNLPQRMSTHKINGYDQSVRPSLSASEDAAPLSSWRLPANRLHSPRSMSADQQQLQQQQQQLQLQQLQQLLQLQQHVRFIGNPNMRQQVKTSWNIPDHRLRRRSLPTRHNYPLPQANLHSDTNSPDPNI